MDAKVSDIGLRSGSPERRTSATRFPTTVLRSVRAKVSTSGISGIIRLSVISYPPSASAISVLLIADGYYDTGGRTSMKEETEKTAFPSPGSP